MSSVSKSSGARKKVARDRRIPAKARLEDRGGTPVSEGIRRAAKRRASTRSSTARPSPSCAETSRWRRATSGPRSKTCSRLSSPTTAHNTMCSCSVRSATSATHRARSSARWAVRCEHQQRSARADLTRPRVARDRRRSVGPDLRLSAMRAEAEMLAMGENLGQGWKRSSTRTPQGSKPSGNSSQTT
jgi:hypothetical protein